MQPSDNGSKATSNVSEPLLKQENTDQSQQGGGAGGTRERPDVSGKTAVSHDAPTAPPKGGDTPEQAGSEKKRTHGVTIPGLGTLVALAQLAIAVCTFGTVVVTGQQLVAMQDQLTQAKRQADAAEVANKLNAEALSASDRAWMHALSTPRSALESGKDFQIRVISKNVGKTPALSVRVNFKTHIVPFAGSYPSPDISNVHQYATIYPDNTASKNLTISAGELDSNLEDIRSGKSAIIVLSSIEYKDVNLKGHLYIGCSMLVVPDIFFSSCPGFSEITD